MESDLLSESTRFVCFLFKIVDLMWNEVALTTSVGTYVQFAGGFDAETMHVFEELRDLAVVLNKSRD